MTIDDTPLRWWRTRHPAHMIGNRSTWERLRTTLVALTPTDEDDRIDSRIRAAWNGDRLAAVDVATSLDLVQDADRDLVYSWVLLGALVGDRKSAATLAIELLQLAEAHRGRRRVPLPRM